MCGRYALYGPILRRSASWLFLALIALVVCTGAVNVDMDFDLHLVGVVVGPNSSSKNVVYISVFVDVEDGRKSGEIDRFTVERDSRIDRAKNVFWGFRSEADDAGGEIALRVVIKSEGCEDRVLAHPLAKLRTADGPYMLDFGRVELTCGS